MVVSLVRPEMKSVSPDGEERILCKTRRILGRWRYWRFAHHQESDSQFVDIWVCHDAEEEDIVESSLGEIVLDRWSMAPQMRFWASSL